MGTMQIASWKCNFGIYLNIQVYYLGIQAITTLLCFLLVIYVLVPSIYSFFYLATALLKSDVFQHSKAYSSHSFQPTGSEWIHCEDETGAYYQLSRLTYKLLKKKLSFLFCPKKILAFQKVI